VKQQQTQKLETVMQKAAAYVRAGKNYVFKELFRFLKSFKGSLNSIFCQVLLSVVYLWCRQDVRNPHLQHTHTHPFNGPFSRTTRVGRYQKGKTNLDFTEARDRKWQWHQLGHMQVCTSPLRFLQAGCPSCRPTNSVKALKAHLQH